MQQASDSIPIDPDLIETSRSPSRTPSIPRSISHKPSSSGTFSFTCGTASPLTRSISDWGSLATEEAEQLKRRVYQLETSLHEQDEKVAYLERKLERQGAIIKRLLEDAGWEADAEDDALVSESNKRAKKRHTRSISAPANKVFTQGEISSPKSRRRRVGSSW